MYYIDNDGNKIPYSSLLDELYYETLNTPKHKAEENTDLKTIAESLKAVSKELANGSQDVL